jgi:hypothetical protein
MKPIILPKTIREDFVLFIGILLLLLGVLLLLERFGVVYGGFWDWFWPVVIIALGLSLVFKHRRSR